MDSRFRNAAFGGFNRQDVTDYLAQLDAGHKKETDDLRARLDERSKSAGEAESARAAAESRAAELEAELDAARRRAEAAEAERDELRAARAEMDRRCAEADAVKADAEAYALLKKNAADVEMDARCRAREIIDRANAQAERTRVLAANWTAALRRRYGESRAQAAAGISRATGELSGAIQTLQQLQRHMEEQSGALDALDKEEN